MANNNGGQSGHKTEKSLSNNIGRMLAKLLLVMTIISLLVSTWLFIDWLYKPGNFPIIKVELVNQLENQESNELQKVVANALNGGFFSLNVEQFREQILSGLPWLKAVSVRKIWPNKLLLTITEHKPVVRWLSVTKDNSNKQQQEIDLLSNEGIIFRPELTSKQQEKFNKMALFMGPDSNAPKILEHCYKMNKSLKKINLGIVRCGMNERRTWMINLNNSMDIKLGKENIMRQLQRFIDVFSGQLKQYLNSVEYADMRYANGFSIHWKSEKKTNVNVKREQD